MSFFGRSVTFAKYMAKFEVSEMIRGSCQLNLYKVINPWLSVLTQGKMVATQGENGNRTG